ncbi:MAG: SWIM zinc finger family protein, partial [Symbiobacteriaceae bacterium]
MASSREHSPLLQQLDDGTLERFAPEPVRVRALDLFLLGRVRNRLVSGNRLLAEVTGTRDTYLVTVDVLASPIGADAIGRCQCPRQGRSGLCKHAVAVLYAWVHEPDTFQSVDRRLDRLEALPRASLLALIRRLVELEPALLAEVDAALPPGEATEAAPPARDASAPGEGNAAPVPRWLRWLEESPDPDPAMLDRLRKELEEVPGEARRAAGLDALLLAALWRQAGLARLAARRGEDRTAAFLRTLWRRLVDLVLAVAAPRQALPAISATAGTLGPAALREAGEALLERGWPGPALALARRALAAEESSDGVTRARHLIARAWLALGRPGEAIPYLAANLAAHPDA